MKRLKIVNAERCTGCHSCEFACAVAHSETKDMNEMVLTGKKSGGRISVKIRKGKIAVVHCHHCKKAQCLLACPSEAIYRDEEQNLVLLDEAKCIGCMKCVEACPFGTLAPHPNGKTVLKCDLCMERLTNGQDPACVEACPTNVITLNVR